MGRMKMGTTSTMRKTPARTSSKLLSETISAVPLIQSVLCPYRQYTDIKINQAINNPPINLSSLTKERKSKSITTSLFVSKMKKQRIFGKRPHKFMDIECPWMIHGKSVHGAFYIAFRILSH